MSERIAEWIETNIMSHAATKPETARATETNDAPPWIDTEGELTIGCLVGENRVTSYVISDRHCLTVTAGRETPPDAESFWIGAGTVDGRQLVSFRVRGSRGLVNLVCRNVRNAIKSKIDKHRRQKANKAAKAGAHTNNQPLTTNH